MKYSFEIKEKAIGKQRPRYSAKLGRMYTPTKTSTFEEKVKFEFLSKYNISTELSTKPIAAKIIIGQAPAKSEYKKKKAELIQNKWDTRRPDIDNITKSILDALNGIAYYDDSQVTKLYAEKIYTEEDKIIVELEEILD